MTIKEAVKKVQEAKSVLEAKYAQDHQYLRSTSIEVADAWKNLKLHKMEFKVKDSSFIASENGLAVNKHVGHLSSDTIDEVRKQIVMYLEGVADSYKNKV